MAVLTQNARKHARGAVAAIVATGLIAFVVAWSGLYNIAASRGHWAIVDWLLSFGMRNSVETRALRINAPPLDNENMVRLGAAHFDHGCAPCHGAPGKSPNPIAQSALPAAPHLADSSHRWKDRELFWIVKHGIKYTGMPAWVSQNRDDEVWAMVAFLKALPQLDDQEFIRFARGTEQNAPRTSNVEWLAQWRCAGCHGSAESRPASNLVPMLHGQSVAFLESALRAYARGARESGIMQPIASDLTATEIKSLATYYAGLQPPAPPSSISTSETEHGRRLALEGAPEEGLPACMTCHGSNALAVYPRLAGQSAAYLAGQLRLWKSGFTPTDGAAAIMAPIAQRLTDRQIDDVSSYFAGLAVRAESRRRN